MNVCESCGAKTRKTDAFCAGCGAKLKNEKPVAARKKTNAGAKKKEKVELSDEVKQRLKRELEISIKAFKEGRISIDEFQSIKKGIVSKAKAGYYDEDPEQTKAEPQTPQNTDMEPSAQRAMIQRAASPVGRGLVLPFSKLWYLVPVIFNIFGGIIAYLAIRDRDPNSAKNMLLIGGASLIVVSGAGGYYLYSLNLLPFSSGTGASEIVVDGAPPSVGPQVLDEGEVVLLNASNGSAGRMNIKPEDLGSEYYINSLLSGFLRDPLEFAEGNSTRADELSAAGWIENHRVVIKKDFLSLDKNKTIVEKEIDSSISKYDANKTHLSYFNGLLQNAREDTVLQNFTLEDLTIGDAGFISKRVDPDPDFDIRVFYRVVFYKKDAFVSIRVSKIGRGLSEAEVKGYAKLIADRIE